MQTVWVSTARSQPGVNFGAQNCMHARESLSFVAARGTVSGEKLQLSWQLCLSKSDADIPEARAVWNVSNANLQLICACRKRWDNSCNLAMPAADCQRHVLFVCIAACAQY